MKARSRSILRTSAVMGVLTAGIYSLLGSGGGGTQPLNWWTGLSHSTVWGAFAVPNTSAPPPSTGCTSNTPPRVEPPDWWSTVSTGITSSSDAVGTTLWSSTDLSCPRAMETLYRSVMVADLSNFYSRFPSGTAQPGNRISKATLDFNVVAMTPTNPLNFPCPPFMGGTGLVNVLQRNAVITQGSMTIPVDTSLRSGLIQASPTGPFNGPAIIGAFPAVGSMVADLATVTAPGTYANGSLVVMDTGPGIHNVKIDVLNSVRGAVNANLQTIGFSVAGINEATITVTMPVQFDCRSWVQPIQLSVDYL